jgi:hypothetical protein
METVRSKTCGAAPRVLPSGSHISGAGGYRHVFGGYGSIASAGYGGSFADPAGAPSARDYPFAEHHQKGFEHAPRASRLEPGAAVPSSHDRGGVTGAAAAASVDPPLFPKAELVFTTFMDRCVGKGCSRRALPVVMIGGLYAYCAEFTPCVYADYAITTNSGH